MKAFLAFVFFFTCLFVSAQYASVSFCNISINQGLSQSSVVDMSFDKNGFIWIATQDGLNRYDGKNFLVLPKKFDDVTSGTVSRLGKIITGENNVLWIITMGGNLEKYNLVNQQFETINLFSGKKKLIATCLMTEKNGMLWIGTENGILLYYDVLENKIIREIEVPGPDKNSAINALFKDSKQQLWIIGKRVGVVSNNNMVFASFPDSNKLKKEIVFSCLKEDGEGNLWLGSLGNGLFVKKLNQPFRQYSAQGSLLPDDLAVEDILVDDEGKIWIGTYGKGLFIIDEKEKTVQQVLNNKKNPFSLAFNDVLTIKQDANKGIWIGTDGGGISYYIKQKTGFILFNNQNVPNDIEIAMVRSLTMDKNGSIWAGTTNKGLTKINYQNEEYKTWPLPSYKKNILNPDRIVSLFADSEGLIWVGTQGNGLFIFDPVKEKFIQWWHPQAPPASKIPDVTAWCIFPASEQHVWVGTQNSGLILFDKQRRFKGSYKPSNQINQVTDAIRSIIQINDSTLCIGFGRSGVQFFNTSSKTFRPVISKELDSIFAIETSIKTLYFKHPYLWMGTDGRGIVALNLANGKCNIITDKDGLPNNTIYGILSDNNDYLWVSTNKGLSRFNIDIINRIPQRSDFINYTSAQGLQSNEFNTGAYYKAADGTMLFGGISGLNVFDPSKFNKQIIHIPVVFTKVLVDNKPLKEDSSASYNKTVELFHGNHAIEFTFAALDFTSTPHHHYFYKLEGYDEEWIDAEQRNYVSYTNIPAGQYTMLVKYVKQSNKNFGPVTKMGILITGPFWKSWWFITGCIILILFLIYLLYLYRISQLLKIIHIRQNIATDLHDDIGSTLSNINILSELSKKSLEDKVQANGFLERISEEVHASSQSLDDIIWSVNNNNDNWQETFSRMRRFAAEIFENSKTEYHIKLQEQSGITKLNMEKRRDIFLIYKEILTNIHKHAVATEVWIDMFLQNQKLIMNIKDNGVGFDKDAQTHRNGLKNLKFRVRRWKGNIELFSGNKGTSIKITL